MAEISEAAERSPTPELLAEQKAVLEEFLEIFPTAVSPDTHAFLEINGAIILLVATAAGGAPRTNLATKGHKMQQSMSSASARLHMHA